MLQLLSARAATSGRWVAVFLLFAAAFGCKNGDGASSKGTSGGDGKLRGTVTVFAAASLTDAFDSVARGFEAEHEGVDVELNFAGSQSLRAQIENGAQPQVFASANTKHMNALEKAGLVRDPVTFAHNQLVIVTPVNNPAGIESLQELPSAKRLVLAGDGVPAGAYALQILDKASEVYGPDFPRRVMDRVVSRETHVRQTLQKVALGEADAAIVYATDAAAAGDRVHTIEISLELNVVASYPIAPVSDSPRHALGRAFIDYVLSTAGQAKLQSFGFRPPSPAR